MATKKPFFTVGLFVILGIFIGVSVLVWVGASRYFQKGTTYLTYFDESVQGLQIDSRVKYQGVDVGWVTRIGVAPDYRLVEVVMKIDFKGDLMNNTVAKLEAAGITGIVFVGLERKRSEYAHLSPKIEFPTQYPVIPSVPSEIQKIFAGVNSVVEQAKQIDFKGISDQVKSTTKSLETFIGGPDVKNIMSSLAGAAQELDAVSKKVNALMDETGRINEVLVEARGAIIDARKVIARVDKEVGSVNAGEIAGKADLLLDNLTRRAQTVTTEVQITSENLRRASETLENLLDRLRADPSEIIFSEPPARDKEGRK
jgi:phospholipid/cholesterol/gamma-HCH transport system substrate-binding protein